MSVDIDVSDDELKAKLTIDVPNKESFPSEDDVKQILADNDIKYGIKEDKLTKIIEKQKNINNEVIAEGDPPSGEDAKLIWHVDINDDNPVIDENGFADYKHVKTLPEVEEDDELVSKLPPTKGKTGTNVFGEKKSPTSPEELQLPKGKNTKISSDGLTLLADKSGNVQLKDGKVNVINVLRISDNVDYSTGNIKYNGEVVIEGDVLSGFRVEADGDITVKGNVEAADVYSHNGDVNIKLGVVGKDRAKILAGGNLHSGFLQDAEAKIKKDVIIDHYSINSTIHSSGKVIIKENEGTIRGGKVIAEEGIDVLQVGSSKGILTKIGVASSKLKNGHSNIEGIIEREQELEKELSLLRKKIEFIELLKERTGDLSKQKESELENLQSERESVSNDLKSLKEKKKSKMEESKESLDRAIYVRENLYNKVEISFGNVEFFNETNRENVKIYKVLNEIEFDEIEKKEERV